MTRIFLFLFLIKAVMAAFGILAYLGYAWAFGVFVIVSTLAIFTDLLCAVIAWSADKDIEKNDNL